MEETSCSEDGATEVDRVGDDCGAEAGCGARGEADDARYLDIVMGDDVDRAGIDSSSISNYDERSVAMLEIFRCIPI